MCLTKLFIYLKLAVLKATYVHINDKKNPQSSNGRPGFLMGTLD